MLKVNRFLILLLVEDTIFRGPFRQVFKEGSKRENTPAIESSKRDLSLKVRKNVKQDELRRIKLI